MKKNLALLGAFALFFSACSSEISDEVVKKYEQSLNEVVKKQLKEFTTSEEIEVKLKDFTCKADKAHIECNSPDFSLNSSGTPIFSAKNIKLRSNEIYTENNASGLISYKDYYAHLFSKNDKLETSVNLESLKLSDESIKQVENNSKALINDEKIAKLMQELSQDNYNVAFNLLTTKDGGNVNYNYSYKIGNDKENFISASLEGGIKEEVFKALDELEIKFDTDKLIVNEKSLVNFNNDSSKSIEAILKQSMVKNFKLDINLQTKDAFVPYINMAKSSLEVLQNQNTNEEQSLLYSKTLELINDISKNPLYKLNLALDFKDIPLSEFNTLKESGVEKITINGKDFSDILKTINQLSQIGMMVP